MSIYRPCYSNRTEVQQAIDFAPGVDVNYRIDRATQAAAEKIDGQFHRVFFPSDDTRFFDWPNQGGSGGGQYADPWRLWLDENDIACLTALVSGGVAIPLSAVFLEPVNNPRQGIPCFDYLELDRSQSYYFTGGPTPQHNIMATGTWGYGADADQVATLAANVASGDTAITVSDGSKAGPGDLLVLGYGRGSAPFPSALGYAGAIQPFLGERLLITDVAAVASGLTQTGAGVTTAETSDQALSWTGSGSLNAGETILLDQEAMYVEQVAGSTATVRRAFNGTTLATHSTGAAINAYRQFAVARAQLGTTASSYTEGAAVYRHRVPGLLRDLAVAETDNQLLQEGSGYARTVGSGESAHPAPGVALADLWDEARTRFGRKARVRAV